MVSIRSLTPSIVSHDGVPGRSHGHRTWRGRDADERDVVPPRPAPRRQPGPARGRRRRRGAAAVRARPGAVGPGRARPPRLPRRLAARPRRPAARSGGRARAWCAATRSAGWCWPRRRSAPSGSTSPPTTAPTATSATRRSRRRCADAGIELVRTGSPYAVAPGRVTNGSGEPYKVYTPFSKAWSDHGWRGPVDPPTGASWLALDEGTDRHPRARAAGRARRCPRPARRRRRGAGRSSSTASTTTTRTATSPGVDGTSHMSVHLKWGEIHPRTMLADLAAQAQHRRRDLPQGAGLAGVLRRRAVRTGRDTARDYLRPEYARMAYDEPGRRSSRPGRRAAPASRSSTPACASSAPPAGCTTGSG